MDSGLVQMIYIVYIFSFRGDVQVQNVSFRGTTSSFMMDLSLICQTITLFNMTSGVGDLSAILR